MKKLVITGYREKNTAVLFEDGKETEICVIEEEGSILNNIYVGRVNKVVPNINSAFVEISKGIICYLPINEEHVIFLNRKNTDKVCQGDIVLVQVVKDAIKTKRPMVTCKLNISGKYVAISFDNQGIIGVSKKITDSRRIDELKTLLKEYATDEYGFIVRTEAEHADNKDICDEVLKLVNEFEDIVRISSMRPAFTLIKKGGNSVDDMVSSMKLRKEDEVITDIPEIYEALSDKEYTVSLYQDTMISLKTLYNIEKIINDALSKYVWLKRGGYLVIEQTEALTVIDVNTGKYDGKDKDREDTFLKINMEAAEEVERQLRLRNISGIVVVDFINMKDDNIKILTDELCAQLKKDIVRCKYVDYTKLGLVEITRQKIRRSLIEYFTKNS